jgi:hypothetical protein
MLRKIFGITGSEWNALSLYGRFEQVVTWILTLFISAIIVMRERDDRKGITQSRESSREKCEPGR